MSPSTKKWIGGGAGLAFFVWLLARPSKAEAAITSGGTFTASQLGIIEKLRTEAAKQGVPPALVLATAEVESNFKNVKSPKGNSFGPLQVNTVHGYTAEQLQNLDFNIKVGVGILKRYLVKAGGDTMRARTYYFCGPNAPCTPAVQERVETRWATAAQRWDVKSSYPV